MALEAGGRQPWCTKLRAHKAMFTECNKVSDHVCCHGQTYSLSLAPVPENTERNDNETHGRHHCMHSIQGHGIIKRQTAIKLQLIFNAIVLVRNMLEKNMADFLEEDMFSWWAVCPQSQGWVLGTDTRVCSIKNIETVMFIYSSKSDWNHSRNFRLYFISANLGCLSYVLFLSFNILIVWILLLKVLCVTCIKTCAQHPVARTTTHFVGKTKRPKSTKTLLLNYTHRQWKMKRRFLIKSSWPWSNHCWWHLPTTQPDQPVKNAAVGGATPSGGEREPG